MTEQITYKPNQTTHHTLYDDEFFEPYARLAHDTYTDETWWESIDHSGEWDHETDPDRLTAFARLAHDDPTFPDYMLDDTEAGGYECGVRRCVFGLALPVVLDDADEDDYR